jgi:hypothetical protein
MIATVVIAAQYLGTVDVLDTMKVDARVTDTCTPAVGKCSLPKIDGNTKEILLSTDLAMSPTIRFRMSDRRLDFTASYSPMLTAPDAELGVHLPSGAPQVNDLQVLQGGFATVGWHDRFVRASLSEAATYGQLNSALLYQLPTAPGQTPSVQSAPVPTTITFGSTATDAAIVDAATRRLNVLLSAGYLGTGGLNAAARDVVADQRGFHAAASLAYELSRPDTLATVANVQDTSTNGPCISYLPTPATAIVPLCAEQVTWAQLQETVSHRFSRTTNLLLGAGATVATVTVPTSTHLLIEPTGIATLSEHFSRDGLSGLDLSAAVTPFVDNRTGLVSDRFQGIGTLSEVLTSTASLSATFGALQSLALLTTDPSEDPYPLTVLNGGVEARIRMDRQLDLRLGEQTLWQYQRGYGTLFSSLGYVSVTASAPPLDF